MLSRVANNLIWLERYMERGHGILNLLSINYYANQDSPELFSWTPIIKMYSPDNSDFTTEDAVTCIEFMVFEQSNPNSILNLVTNARENARSVQEHISREIWLCLNKYYHFVTDKQLRKGLKDEDPVVFLEKLKSFHLGYYGTMDATQERGPSYYFLNVGRYLERVIQISDFTSLKLMEIGKTSDTLIQSFYWKNLLLSIGGFRHYLKRHKSTFQKEYIIEMIFRDELYPRSVYYCIKKLNHHINRLITANELEGENLNFLLGKLESRIKYSTMENINEQGLESFIKEIKEDIKNISFAVNAVYFSHSN